MRIAKKINLSFLVLALVLGGISVTIFYGVSRNNLKEAICRHLNTTARSRANHIEAFLTDRKAGVALMARAHVVMSKLRALSAGNARDEQDVQILNRGLRELAKSDIRLSVLSALDSRGEVVASSEEQNIGLDRSGQACFQEGGRDVYVSDVHHHCTTSEPCLSISSPVRENGTGRLLGVIVAAIPVSGLNRITAARTGLGKTGEIYLVNSDGYMITTSRFVKDSILKLRIDTEVTRKCSADVKEYGLRRHPHEPAVYPDYRGVSVLGQHEHIHEMKWCLCAEIDEKEAFAPLDSIRLIALTLFCLTLFASWLIGGVVSRALSRPIDKLRKGVEAIGPRNLDHKVGTDADDEIGQLSRAFDEMTANLKLTTASIDDLNHEITRRKITEEYLAMAKTSAEAATKAKSTFLANMSHELRTPMNAILGFSSIVAEQELAPEQGEYVQIIQDCGRHLLAVINDILNISMIEAGEIDISIVDCPLDALLGEVESQIRLMAEQNGLAFAVRRRKDLPGEIRTDPVRLRQCLLNLAGNAVKYTEDGRVCLNVSLQQWEGEECICFDVEDTGIGIPANKLDTVFDMFIQVDDSTSRRFNGAGLGLAITKQLVELLGGRLSATSEEGKGSVFSIALPSSRAAVGLLRDTSDTPGVHGIGPDDGAEPADESKFSGPVLVVEDVDANSVLIRLLLERMGFEVTLASDGSKAIEMALDRHYKVIFMDMHMPVMDGYEATGILRERGVRTPIIAVTARAMQGDDERCMKAGCDDYVSKPIDRRELSRVISKYVPNANVALVESDDSDDSASVAASALDGRRLNQNAPVGANDQYNHCAPT
ncbi:MAG: response regulator [Phycisphaerae bacterium]|nr:response regulator [Phycisphaerae bacterium]